MVNKALFMAMCGILADKDDDLGDDQDGSDTCKS